MSYNVNGYDCSSEFTVAIVDSPSSMGWFCNLGDWMEIYT